MKRVLAAEAAARRELATVPDWLWDGKTLPVPIDAIADSHYGLLVREHEDLATAAGMTGHLSGLLLPDVREVWVNADEAPVRRRFTVGHEIGHWVLHCGSGLDAEGAVRCRESEVREEAAGEDRDPAATYLRYPPDELDANQFAAALLMPASALRTLTLSTDARELARGLGVSADALSRRLWFLQQADTAYRSGGP